jgi:hypothetical protein
MLGFIKTMKQTGRIAVPPDKIRTLYFQSMKLLTLPTGNTLYKIAVQNSRFTFLSYVTILCLVEKS